MNYWDRFKVYKAWVVSKQMCHDRGYLVTQDMMEMPYDRWEEMHGDKIRRELSYYVRKDSGDPTGLLVYFPVEPDVSTVLIKSLHERITKENSKRVIIVYRGKLAGAARKAMEVLKDSGFVFEVFTEAELAINVTRHRLVPKHDVLTEAEKQQLLDRYSITPDKLPIMQEVDPIARYFGLSHGQVVRITRTSETAGRYVTYRIVMREI
ncbi:hypothetical protein PTSG_01026 [Salpingoeca rosetta]|uniref:Uncharacterized protein n=1 Tax=Salpingoeca rosetta (strain ATCC 50818 / BSB-021) TaxID=946362 RepID=F2TY65_SALR5|nr:uncharacterized protein PTSG_01026 [Salpingoeca rosetta]EGD76324.1 hypothetical protein PTSG_01026 [Salpingoeca rosetta]|eukprot:XP_004998499.1 hypothetical protein PTSG_01026 [Salpingoeca rosetta]